MLEDFSHEHMYNRTRLRLIGDIEELNYWRLIFLNGGGADIPEDYDPFSDDPDIELIDLYLDAEAKEAWWQMIQLLPSNYNQTRNVMLNYEVLANIYKSRRNHKLDEWRVHKTPEEHEFRNKDFSSGMWGFCDWIESLPYSELITGEK